MYRAVLWIALSVGKPPDHPSVSGFARFARSSMRSVAHKEFNPFSSVVEPIPAPRLVVYGSRTLRPKVIFGCGHHQPRKRRCHFEEIRYIEPVRKECRKAHLGIGSRPGKQRAKRV